MASVNDVLAIQFNDDAYTGETNGNRAIFSKFDKATETDLTFTANGGVYEAVITADMLLNLMSINTFNLPTKAAYDAFSLALSGIGQIGVEITDTTVVQ